MSTSIAPNPAGNPADTTARSIRRTHARPATGRWARLPHILGGAVLSAVVLSAVLAAPAAAQDPIGSSTTQDTLEVGAVFEEMQAQLERLIPVMRRLALTLQDVVPELEGTPSSEAGRDAIARRARGAAHFTRAYFDALLAEGFTREEALRIVSGVAGRP